MLSFGRNKQQIVTVALRLKKFKRDMSIEKSFSMIKRIFNYLTCVNSWLISWPMSICKIGMDVSYAYCNALNIYGCFYRINYSILNTTHLISHRNEFPKSNEIPIFRR